MKKAAKCSASNIFLTETRESQHILIYPHKSSRYKYRPQPTEIRLFTDILQQPSALQEIDHEKENFCYIHIDNCFFNCMRKKYYFGTAQKISMWR